jgi:hypothetical protein
MSMQTAERLVSNIMTRAQIRGTNALIEESGRTLCENLEEVCRRS